MNPTRRRPWRLLTTVIALALLAGACGDDDGPSSASLDRTDSTAAGAAQGEDPDATVDPEGDAETAPDPTIEDDGSATGSDTAPVSVTGDPLTPIDHSTAAHGAMAPELTGTSIDGEPIAIVHDGRPKVIAVLAHWCPHCQDQVPRIIEWIDAGHLPDDVDLVAVSTAVAPDSPSYPPSTWFATEGWTVPTLVDDADASAHRALGAGGFPSFVAVDATGTVVTTHVGVLDASGLGGLVDAARTGVAG